MVNIISNYVGKWVSISIYCRGTEILEVLKYEMQVTQTSSVWMWFMAEHLYVLMEQIARVEDALFDVQFEQHWLHSQTARQYQGKNVYIHPSSAPASIRRASKSPRMICCRQRAKTITLVLKIDRQACVKNSSNVFNLHL